MSVPVNIQLTAIAIVLLILIDTTIIIPFLPYVVTGSSVLISGGGSLRDGDVMRMSLKGIERTVRYYQENFREMNIDGIFALRMIQGQVSSLKQYLQVHISNNEDLKYLKKLEDLAHLSEKIANTSVPHLVKMNDESMKLVGWVVTNPWTHTFNDVRLLNPKYFQTYKPHLLDLLNDLEDLSDFCIGEITKSCNLKNECLNYILKDDTMSYELTHQILNIIIIHMVNCTDAVNKQIIKHHLKRRRHSKKNHHNNNNYNNKNDVIISDNNYIDLLTSDGKLLHNDPLSHLEEKYCTYSFIEMSMILKKHDSLIPLHFIDIFAEHMFICPSMGFIQFLHQHWLVQTMTRQKKIGCWDFDGHDVIDDLNDELKKLATEVKEARRGRRLMEDILLKDGCSVHLTSVTLCSVMCFLRYAMLGLFVDERFQLPEINYLMEPQKLPGYSAAVSQAASEVEELEAKVLILFYSIVVLFIFSFIYLVRRFYRGSYMFRFSRRARFSKCQML